MDYITHEVIYDKLLSLFKSKEFDEEDILNWCQEVETLYIADPDSMFRYEKIPLAFANGKAVLPPNFYQLVDVYDSHDRALSYRRRRNTLFVPNYADTALYINYVGTPLDERCMPLIHADHQAACEAYCKINSFQEEALKGTINYNLYNDWQLRFDGMIISAKSSYRSWDAQKFQKMDVIIGAQIPKIGYMPLAHTEFKGMRIND